MGGRETYQSPLVLTSTTHLLEAGGFRTAKSMNRTLKESTSRVNRGLLPSLPDNLTVIFGPITAQTISQKWPNISDLLKSTPKEQSDAGLDTLAQAKLKALVSLWKIWTTRPGDRRLISSPADAYHILAPYAQDKDQEYLWVLHLDTRNRVIGEPFELYHGSLNTSLIRVGEVFKMAVRLNCAGVIIAHLHPSGDPTPSPEDIAVTRALADAGKLLDIELLDHLIIGNGRFISLKERGFLQSK
jgi:DNA repair protein RadC